MGSQHAADVELARLCERGDEQAWERFVRDYRPILYRAAHALDPSGGAREIADSLYAELYGVRGGGESRSLFRYFEGRSSLATWLRAVLAQRFVDQVRARRRLEPLPDEEPTASSAGRSAHTAVAGHEPPDVERPRYLAIVRDVLARAIGNLSARDRLRLRCYYVQELTLAETGRVMTEHEATVSRQLSRSRRMVREFVEQHLHEVEGMSDVEIAECFASVAADPGPLDLTHVFGAVADRKEPAAGRSG